MVAFIIILLVGYLSIVNTQVSSYLLNLSLPIMTYMLGYLIGAKYDENIKKKKDDN